MLSLHCICAFAITCRNIFSLSEGLVCFIPFLKHIIQLNREDRIQVYFTVSFKCKKPYHFKNSEGFWKSWKERWMEELQLWVTSLSVFPSLYPCVWPLFGCHWSVAFMFHISLTPVVKDEDFFWWSDLENGLTEWEIQFHSIPWGRLVSFLIIFVWKWLKAWVWMERVWVISWRVWTCDYKRREP